jgi:anti-sigma B factor antagonist
MLAQNINVEQTGNIAVATIITPLLSVNEGQEIIGELTERMRYNNARHFILDLKEVEFMDSSFLGSLVSLLQDVEHVRGRIALVHCQPNVAFLFKVTRLDAVFSMFESVEDAKTELQK